jgi:PilZ domain
MPTSAIIASVKHRPERAENTASERNKVSSALIERRRHPRCSLKAAISVYEQTSGARIEVRTTDLCYGGCYVDTMNPFAQGTRVKIPFDERCKVDGG